MAGQLILSHLSIFEIYLVGIEMLFLLRCTVMERTRVMSYCCLTPIQQFFSYIMARTS